MTDPVINNPYADYDLVYVDPETSTVVGRIEWNKNGNPKSLPIVQKETPGKEERRRSWRKFYPWGTYRSMKNVYKVDGKPRKKEPNKTLEQVMPLALQEPYWD